MNKVYHGFSHSSGVYKITNKDNGLVYFGQAAQLATRAMQHEKALLKNKHDNNHLQNAWNKYGPDAFEFEVIAVYSNKTERNAAEQALIDENYGPGCYNIMKKVLPAKGTWSHTPEETRKRMSDSGKKRPPMTQETKDKIGAAHTGRTFSEDYRAKLSASNMGVKRSAETCAKVSAANKGRKMSIETREKMSVAAKAAWLLRSSK